MCGMEKCMIRRRKWWWWSNRCIIRWAFWQGVEVLLWDCSVHGRWSATSVDGNFQLLRHRVVLFYCVKIDVTLDEEGVLSVPRIQCEPLG